MLGLMSAFFLSIIRKTEREVTHVHVQHLSISSLPADGGGDDHELIFGDEVADTAFFALAFVAGVGGDVEFEGGDEGEEEGEEEVEGG